MTPTKLFSPDRKFLWLFVAFIVKGLFFFPTIFMPHFTEVNGTWGIYGGDADTYTVPIDNWLKTSQYTPDYRIPGYGVIYLFFRLFFEKVAACNALVVTQYVLDSIATYTAALIALKLFKSKLAFYFTFIVLLVSYYVSIFNNLVSTDSLTASLVIFWIYYLYAYFQNQKLSSLIISGLLITWIIFLRPVYAPLLFFGLGLWLVKFKLDKIKLLKQLLIFIMPFFIAESIWLYHNYQEHKQIIFFKKGGQWYPFQYKNSFPELVTFIQSWGGDYVFWQPNSAINWFGLQDYRPVEAEPYHLKTPDDSIIIPDDIYTSAFNRDSLIKIREFMPIAWDDKKLDATTHQQYNDLMRNQLNGYTASVKAEKPLLYFVKAPLRILWKFISFDTFRYVYAPFDTTKPEQAMSIKQSLIFYLKVIMMYFYEILYYLILFLGVAGALKIIFDFHKFYTLESLIAVIALYGILVFPFVFRSAEARYWIVTYPCLVICASYCLQLLFGRKIKINES